jgi:hypothetical protein
MIADIDIRPFPVDLVPTVKLIADKSELAEDPTPQVKEKVSD